MPVVIKNHLFLTLFCLHASPLRPAAPPINPYYPIIDRDVAGSHDSSFLFSLHNFNSFVHLHMISTLWYLSRVWDDQVGLGADRRCIGQSGAGWI